MIIVILLPKDAQSESNRKEISGNWETFYKKLTCNILKCQGKENQDWGIILHWRSVKRHYNQKQNRILNSFCYKGSYCGNWQNLNETLRLGGNNTAMLISWFWYSLCNRQSLTKCIFDVLSNGWKGEFFVLLFGT